MDSDLTDKIPKKELQELMTLVSEGTKIHSQINRFNELCWDICISKPGSSLNQKSATCIANCVDRFIDVTTFIALRFEQRLQRNASETLT